MCFLSIPWCTWDGLGTHGRSVVLGPTGTLDKVLCCIIIKTDKFSPPLSTKFSAHIPGSTTTTTIIIIIILLLICRYLMSLFGFMQVTVAFGCNQNPVVHQCAYNRGVYRIDPLFQESETPLPNQSLYISQKLTSIAT